MSTSNEREVFYYEKQKQHYRTRIYLGQKRIDATGYVFPTEEGVFKAVLDCKRYGKTRNLIGYFTLENGQTIMISAWQNDNYHGLQEVPFGALMELEFVKNNEV